MKTKKIDWWKISDKIIKIFLILFIGIALGYGWAYSIYLTDNSKCEKDSLNLETEFHEAVQKPRSFHIFNHQFEVYPISVLKKQFAYRKARNEN